MKRLSKHQGTLPQTIQKRATTNVFFGRSKWWPNELRNFENPKKLAFTNTCGGGSSSAAKRFEGKYNLSPRFFKTDGGRGEVNCRDIVVSKGNNWKKAKVTHKLHGFLENSELQHVQLSNHSAFASNCSDTKKHTKTHSKSHMLRLQNWLKAFVGDVARPKYPRILARGAIHQCHPSQGFLWGRGLLLGNHGTVTMGTTHRVIDGLLAVMLREVSSFPSWPDIKVRREQKPDIAKKLTCRNKEFALQRAWKI